MTAMRRLVLLSLGALLACSKSDKSDETRISAPPPTGTASHSYSTDFPRTESPISDGGNWLNGQTNGVDWTDVSTTLHRAIGHQIGGSYTDATAILNGTWDANQRATATVFTSGAISDDCYSEVELRLRSSIASHAIRGYEVSFKVSETAAAYLIIVRWNGALGDFTYLRRDFGTQYGVKNGDVISATIVGNTITAYKNGTGDGAGERRCVQWGKPRRRLQPGKRPDAVSRDERPVRVQRL